MTVAAEGRVSDYILEFDLGEGMLLSNILWRTFLRLDPAQARAWREWRLSPSEEVFEAIPRDLVSQLHQKKLLLEPEADERQTIVRRYQDTRYSPYALGLTIAPTIDCNFACVYCYEDKRPGRMTREVEEQIVSYAERMVPGRTTFSVTWYGGEPLLCKDTIYRLSREFIRICEQNQCRYTSDMVTNGLLLTAAVVDELARIGHFDSVQITIDGEGSAHDVKRPTKSGRPTFERVLKNLVMASRKLPMTLRMNVDLLNLASCHALLERLASEGCSDTLKVSFAPIHPFGSGCCDVSEEVNVQVGSNVEFARIEPDLIRHADALGFRTSTVFGGPWLVQCQAVSSNSYVVEPDGSLQRCWIEVGEDDKRVGHISRPVEFTGANNMRWMTFDPTRNEPCVDCKVLPLCFGGCPHRHVYGAPEEFTCNQIRYNVRERVLADYIATYEPSLAASVPSRSQSATSSNASTRSIPISIVRRPPGSGLKSGASR